MITRNDKEFEEANFNDINGSHATQSEWKRGPKIDIKRPTTETRGCYGSVVVDCRKPHALTDFIPCFPHSLKVEYIRVSLGYIQSVEDMKHYRFSGIVLALSSHCNLTVPSCVTVVSPTNAWSVMCFSSCFTSHNMLRLL